MNENNEILCLRIALNKIANWDDHSEDFIDIHDKDPLRDMYRKIAKDALSDSSTAPPSTEIQSLKSEIQRLKEEIKRLKDDLKPDPWDDLGKHGNTGY
jgi:uncharacterized small protein (DUF1192 family)